MHLVKCGACGGDVSDEAQACPKCGQPTARAKMMAWAYPLAIVLVATGALWFLARIAGEIVKAAQSAIPLG
jgi:hypothetical protein